MSAPLSVFPSDRSHKWILVPGSASTRQIELCNESDAAVECHITVQEPATASAAPEILSLEKGQSSTAEVNFLPSWSPLRDRRVRVIVRDAEGGVLADFSQDVIAAHSADCSISLTWSEPVIVDANLAGFRLWCKITSRGTVPGTFEIDFTPHPALRFPERKLVTLAPGESSALEVLVEWNRAVRDVEGWNHPPAVEATVPLSDGQRSAIVPWNAIEDRVAVYLTADDRKARVPERKTSADQSYKKLLDMRALEQGVVGPAQPRTLISSAEPASSARPPRRLSVATLIITAMALIAVATAVVLFVRPWEPQATVGPVHVPPLLLPPPTSSHSSVKSRQVAAGKAAAAVPNVSAVQANSSQPASAGLAQNAVTPRPGSTSNAVASVPKQLVKAGAAKPATRTAAVKSASKALPQQRSAAGARVDRNAVVIALADPDVEYTSQGRAVSVRWFVQAQSHAIVEVLDNRNVTIARYSVPGTVSHAVLRLPRGYRGPVNVQVTSIGYHGERVVQSASLSPPS